jgi:hypothetical protein
LPSIAAPKEADFSIQKDGYKKWVPVDKADYENALAVRETRWTERAKAWEDLLPKDLPSPSNTILNYFTFVQRASFFTTGEPLDLRTEESIHKFIVERFFAFSGRDIESELADIDFQPFLMESIAFHGAPFFDEDGGPDSSYVPDSELPGPDFRPPVKDDSVDDDPYE